MSLVATAYWVTRRGAGELRTERVAASPRPGWTVLRASQGGISPGSERLVGLGRVPRSCTSAMACRYMQGSFDLPVKYGYDLVGRGIAGELAGERLFVMHPHQDVAEIEDAHATRLPPSIPDARAILIPNLETALNAVWDAELRADDRALVLGAGPVGLLVAFVLRSLHPGPSCVADIDPDRRAFAASLPWISEVREAGSLEPSTVDVALHTSGDPAGLSTALTAVGFEGRVVELSWYGDRTVELELGTHFHYQRKRILASQVAAIAPPVRASTGHRERMATVLRLLAEPNLDRLLGPALPFAALPAFMSELYHGRVRLPLPVIEYPCSA